MVILIGKEQCAFEKIDVAVELEKLRREKTMIEIQQMASRAARRALKAEIVDRKDGFRCRGFRVARRLELFRKTTARAACQSWQWTMSTGRSAQEFRARRG